MILASAASFIGSVWFALLLGVVGLVAGFWLRPKIAPPKA